MRFHQSPQNSVQFKTYELFISGIFHLIFSDRGGPQAIEIKKLWIRGTTAYTDVKSFCCAPETNMSYVHYNSIKKTEKTIVYQFALQKIGFLCV